MRFLGKVGYYRAFCGNFSSVAAPHIGEWSPMCRRAFLEVKALTSSAPVLAAPRMREPFKLQVDASKFGA